MPTTNRERSFTLLYLDLSSSNMIFFFYPMNSKKLIAVIIKGNPKYLKNNISESYYQEMKGYLEQKNCIVEFDAGEDYTVPRLDADLYIGHSRGACRYDYMPEGKQKVFLKFGTPEGIIDPIDLKWQNDKWYPGTDEQPPKEHFIFITEQRKSIDELIAVLNGVAERNCAIFPASM